MITHNPGAGGHMSFIWPNVYLKLNDEREKQQF